MRKLNVFVRTADECFGKSLSEVVVQCDSDVTSITLEPESIFTGKINIDLILLDIRESSETAIDFLKRILKAFPHIDVLLINRPDNIRSSMLAMQAGARDELTTPIDTHELKEKIAASKSRMLVRNKAKSLVDRFNDAMVAVTFAQAGEFETALEFIKETPMQEPEAPREKDISGKPDIEAARPGLEDNK